MIVEPGKNGKTVKKQLEVDFVCSKGSKKYYIQSAYSLETEEKMIQEIRPFTKINDFFKKIVITSNTPKPFYNDDGILIMSVFDFLLKQESLELWFVKDIYGCNTENIFYNECNSVKHFLC